MSTYRDLTDNVDENFPFMLRGKKYEMRYPKTRELEAIQEINDRYEEMDPSTPEAKELAKTLSGAMYEFIDPVDHDLDIKEALKDENTQVLRKFHFMIKTELAVQ